MEVAVCCICRLENNYLNEWVNHYIKLGFDKIFIYDNNDEDGERPEEVLQEACRTGKVKVINFRRFQKAQFDAYTNCYNTYKDKFDWIAFFDCDEFLMLDSFDNIHDFLSQKKFDKCDSIVINWKVYGDSDLTGNDKIINYNLVDRLVKPADLDKVETKTTKYNNYTYKKIVKTCYNTVYVNHCHYISDEFSNYVTAEGKKVVIDTSNNNVKSFTSKITYKEAVLNHYATKTITEFMHNKYKQGDAISGKDKLKEETIFWSINKKTPYKQRIVKKIKSNLSIEMDPEPEAIYQSKDDFVKVNKNSISDLLFFAESIRKRK